MNAAGKRAAGAVSILVLVLVFASIVATAGASAGGQPSSSIVYLHGERFRYLGPNGEDLGKSGFLGLEEPFAMAASPDGRQFAVLQYRQTAGAYGEFYSVILFTREGSSGYSRKRRLIRRPTYVKGALSVNYSPDGRLLAVGAGKEIRLINVATGRQRLLLTPPRHFEYDIQPRFTADGRGLIFAHGNRKVDGGATDLFEVSLGGHIRRRLTRTPASELFPVPAPDGRHLAYLRGDGLRNVDDPSGYEVVVAGIDGGDERVVGRGAAPLSPPAFSPDGSHLSFTHRTSAGEYGPVYFDLYTVSTAGGDLRRLLRRVEGGTFIPVWTVNPDET